MEYPGRNGASGDDAPVCSSLSDEGVCESPKIHSRAKRLDRPQFRKSHARPSSSQKRLHPPNDSSGRTGGDGCCCDPSHVIPTELLFRCTGYLDSESLLNLQLASTCYRFLARRNDAGWADLCHNLWRDKAAIAFCHPASSEEPRYEPPGDWMHAHFSSILDAKRRFLTVQDLVFDPPDGSSHDGTTRVGRLQNHDPTSPASLLHRFRRANKVWSFRFKESAGSDWTEQDPWYSGEPCRKFVFMRDGSILQYASVPPADAAKKEDQSGSGRRFFGSNPAAESGDCPSVSTSYQLTDPPLPMRWRFLSNHPLDLPDRPLGSYVRISVGGRDVPTYSVFRCEANWGFAMESCWGLFANFELPPRRQRRGYSLAGRQREAASSVAPRPDEGDEDDSQARNRESREIGSPHWTDPSFLRLRDDASLFITNEVQWREAFLYNAGAIVLPEGQEATSHFDRAWQGSRNPNPD